jgi:hypothetical protein
MEIRMSQNQKVVTVKITEDDLATIIAALESEAENAHANAEAIGVTIAVEDKFTGIAENYERIALHLHASIPDPTRPSRYRITGYGHKTTTTPQEV